jgi:hypothetical protein
VNNKELDELLEKNFSNVNSWLNFAEAKNAANIALVVACIAAIFSLDDMNVLLYIICVVFIISGICSLLSFFPRMGNERIRKKLKIFKIVKDKEPQNANLLFFENIKGYAGNDYIKRICDLYFKEKKYNPTKYQLDLSDEIVYNSGIASCK